jgi:hypothetical protein
VNKELGKMWKKGSWGVIPSFLEELTKYTDTPVRIACFRGRIWTRDIPNTKQDYWSWRCLSLKVYVEISACTRNKRNALLLDLRAPLMHIVSWRALNVCSQNDPRSFRLGTNKQRSKFWAGGDRDRIVVLCVITLFTLVCGYRRFGRHCSIHHQSLPWWQYILRKWSIRLPERAVSQNRRLQSE